MRDWLEQVEAAKPPEDELLAMLAWIAGQDVEIDPEERNGAVRRALLIHASGGGLERELTLDAPAGETLAADLDDETGLRRAELGRGLAAMREQAARLPFVRDVLGRLLADMQLAWRAYAIALLAEELAGSADDTS